MGYKTSGTTCVVRLVSLSLNKTQMRQCADVRREAGCCWTDMIEAHVANREGQWLTQNDLKRDFKGQYDLHSQSVQALAEKLDANVQTAKTLREQGKLDIEYPYRQKAFQTVTWKYQAISVQGGH